MLSFNVGGADLSYQDFTLVCVKRCAAYKKPNLSFTATVENKIISYVYQTKYIKMIVLYPTALNN